MYGDIKMGVAVLYLHLGKEVDEELTEFEWLRYKKAECERGIEFYQNKIDLLKRDLGAIESLLYTAEGQPMGKGGSGIILHLGH